MPARIVGDLDQRRFFLFRNEIFDYMREGEELVEEPFQRLIESRPAHGIQA